MDSKNYSTQKQIKEDLQKQLDEKKKECELLAHRLEAFKVGTLSLKNTTSVILTSPKEESISASSIIEDQESELDDCYEAKEELEFVSENLEREVTCLRVERRKVEVNYLFQHSIGS